MHVIMLVLFNLINLITKILSFIVFPISYYYRDKLRMKVHFTDQKGLKLFKQNPKFYELFLWFFLDDSIYNENVVERQVNKEYCVYGKKCYIIEKLLKEGNLKEFLRSYYWNVIRNSSENFWMYIAFGPATQVLKTIVTKRLKYEIRKYPKCKFPLSYLDYYIWIFHFSTGFYSGNGKFKGITLKRKK